MKNFVNEECIGCGLCISACPEVFKTDDNGLAAAVSHDIPKALEDAALKALADCPVSAIQNEE